MKLNRILSQYGEIKPEVIPTGIQCLDKMICGLPIGNVCTIGGRPAMGKTAMALTIARNIGIDQKIPTAILSFELDERMVVRRILATEFGYDKVEMGGSNRQPLTYEQEKAVALLTNIGFNSTQQKEVDFINKMKSAPVWIESRMHATMEEVIAQAERLKKENDIKVLVIDSLNWILSCYTYNDREQTMQKLVETAARLKIAIVATSELTRDVENRGGVHVPQLSDLRGGFSAETYSSIVLLIYRPEYYGIMEDDTGNTKDMADIIVAKNNIGETGIVRLRFINHSRFEDTNLELNIENEIAAITESIF